MFSKYVRGMVYWCNFPKIDMCEHLNYGRRPCIIISNNIGNYSSPNVTVIPLTTNTERSSQATHCIISLNPREDSMALTESMMTLDKKCLDDFMGILSEVEMNKIDKCINIALGLVHIDNPFDKEDTRTKEEKEADQAKAKTKYLEEKKKANKGRRITGTTDMMVFIQYAESHTKEETMAEYGLPSEASIQSRLQYYRNKIKR